MPNLNAIWQKLVTPAERPWADRLLKSTAWTFAGAMSGQIFGLLGGLLAARILGGDGFGRLSAVRGLVTSFGLISGAGLGVVAVRYLAEVREKDQAALTQRVGFLQRISEWAAGIATFIAVLLAPVMAGQWLHEKSLTVALWVGSPLVLFNGLSAIQNGMLGGLEKFRLVARSTLVEASGNFAGVLVGALTFGVAGAVGGASLAAFIAFVYRRSLLQKELVELGVKPTGPLQIDRQWMLHEALPYMMVGIIPQPVEWFARIMLVRNSDGFTELGLFSVAFTCTQVLIFLPRQFAAPGISLLTGLMAGDNPAMAADLARLKLRVTLLLAAFIAIPMLALADYIPGWFGYHAGGDVLVVLVLANLLATCALVFRSVLYSAGKMWVQCAHVVVWSAVLLFGWESCQSLGALGLACAYLGAYAVHIVFQGLDAARTLMETRISA